MEDYTEKGEERIKIQDTILNGWCLYLCRRKERLTREKEKLDEEIEEAKKKMYDLKRKEDFGPLYILTFENKEDYDEAYSKFPHSYLIEAIKGICKKEKKKKIYINKAPNPEDVAWENLQFDNEYKYFKIKFVLI